MDYENDGETNWDWCARYRHRRIGSETEGIGNNRLSRRGCPRGVMVKAVNCGIVVREFVHQSHYYVHFRANTLGKGMNPLILPSMG